MNDALRELLAKQAIAEVLHRYCRAVDRIDRELGRSCWHDGATADYEDAFQGPATELVDWVCGVHEDAMAGHSHQVTNIDCRIRGERAASESYVTVVLRTKGGPGEAIDIVSRGRYLDRWSCRDGIWAIDHRQHVTDLRRMVPAPTGDVVVTAARRDRTDPSYELLAI